MSLMVEFIFLELLPFVMHTIFYVFFWLGVIALAWWGFWTIVDHFNSKGDG